MCADGNESWAESKWSATSLRTSNKWLESKHYGDNGDAQQWHEAHSMYQIRRSRFVSFLSKHELGGCLQDPCCNDQTESAKKPRTLSKQETFIADMIFKWSLGLCFLFVSFLTQIWQFYMFAIHVGSLENISVI